MTLEENKNNKPSADETGQGGFVDFEGEQASDSSSEDFSAYMPTPEKYLQEQQALQEVHQPKDFEEILPRSKSLEKILKIADPDALKAVPAEKVAITEETRILDDSKYMPGQELPEQEPVEEPVEEVQQEPEVQEHQPIELEQPEPEYAELLPAAEPENAIIIDACPDAGSEDVSTSEFKYWQQQSSGLKTEQQDAEAGKNISDKDLIIDDFKDEDVKTFCAVCHLSNVILVTAFWVPFLMYLSKRSDPFVKFHAIQSIIYSLFLLLIGAVVVLSSSIILMGLQCPCVLCLILPVGLVVMGILWGYAIYIVVQVYKGIDFQIPYIAEAVYRIIELIEQ